jgi:hypothetical protein
MDEIINSRFVVHKKLPGRRLAGRTVLEAERDAIRAGALFYVGMRTIVQRI